MNHAFFAIPGDISAATGGYAYDRHVIAECKAAAFELEHIALPGSFPAPDNDDLATTRRLLAGLDDSPPILIDGLALGAFDQATLQMVRGPLVALVHHPLAFETGITEERKTALLRSEKEALAKAASVIAVSRATADLLITHYNVSAAAITIAEPGVARASRATGSGGGPLSLLAVGAISQRKGYPVLIEALSRLVALDWQLTIVGPTLDAHEEKRIAALIGAHKLEQRVRLTGKVTADELSELYDRADLFVMPSFFEGYGMVVTEALARGLPIISTTGGALAATVPEEASLKVAPGDSDALRKALYRMIGEPSLRLAKAEAAWQKAGDLPSWSGCAAIIVDGLRRASR